MFHVVNALYDFLPPTPSTYLVNQNLDKKDGHFEAATLGVNLTSNNVMTSP